MKIDDVPQDKGVIDDYLRVNYAVDENGKYTIVKSAGCDTVNFANDQAWEVVHKRTESVKKRVLAGELSPLAYHMTKNLMDKKMLAQCVKMFKWSVSRHFKPTVFKKLDTKTLQRYADGFGITIKELTSLPE
ncbi:hypothetical protein KKA14_11625 [bacterium]|nr:hypothetical protein [bacterium]